MRRMRAAAVAVVVACGALVSGAAPASAGGPVDPSTLVPEPPPGADCRSTGGGAVLCHTVFDASFQNEPAFVFPCGQVYESAQDVRRGTRWYDDGRLTRRFVFQAAAGSWSLSPEGSGPTVTWVAHDSWQNIDIDADAPEETWATTTHGMDFRVMGPSGSPLLHVAGLDLPTGEHRGTGDFATFESPEFQDAVCTALTG
jgi:hypothetical protein